MNKSQIKEVNSDSQKLKKKIIENILMKKPVNKSHTLIK